MFSNFVTTRNISGTTVFIEDKTRKVLLMVITETYNDTELFTGDGACDELRSYGIDLETDFDETFDANNAMHENNGITCYFLDA